MIVILAFNVPSVFLLPASHKNVAMQVILESQQTHNARTVCLVSVVE